MTVLWLAFGIYIIGIATVLFLRPNIMFRPGAGTWKEFGLNNTGNYTIFPFWMFTLLWAILSYVFATIGAIFFASLAMPKSASATATATAAAAENANILPITSMTPNADLLPTPTMPKAPAYESAPAPSVPGYYILQPTANGAQYVYFGTTPPQLQQNLIANSR